VVRFEIPDSVLALRPEELLAATLRLFLLRFTGSASTSIRMCGAGQSWTEPGVTWNSQPQPEQPCDVIQVGALQQYYEWDATDNLRPVIQGAIDRGFVFNNTNEVIVNLREFHSRQSTAAERRPELELHVAGEVVPDVTAGFSIETEIVSLSLTSVSPIEIRGIELYSAEQIPSFPPLVPLGAPPGWFFDPLLDVPCEAPGGAVESDGIRIETQNPLGAGQSALFTFRASQPIDTEIIQLQLTGSAAPRQQEAYLGRVFASRAPPQQPPPELGLATDREQYALGDPLTLLVDVRNPANQTVVVDPYIVLQLPGGELYSYVFPIGFVPIDPADFVATLLPVVSSFPLPPGLSAHDIALFTASLGAEIPAQAGGVHRFFAALAEPGTLNLLTPIDQVDFHLE